MIWNCFFSLTNGYLSVIQIVHGSSKSIKTQAVEVNKINQGKTWTNKCTDLWIAGIRATIWRSHNRLMQVCYTGKVDKKKRAKMITSKRWRTPQPSRYDEREKWHVEERSLNTITSYQRGAWITNTYSVDNRPLNLNLSLGVWSSICHLPNRFSFSFAKHVIRIRKKGYLTTYLKSRSIHFPIDQIMHL